MPFPLLPRIAFVTSICAVLLLAACSAPGLSGRFLAGAAGEVPSGDLHGVTVSGPVEIAFEPSETFEVSHVRFLVNGMAIGEADAAGKFTVQLDTTDLFDGEHAISVIGFEANGEQIPGAPFAMFKVANRGTEHGPTMPRADGYTLKGDPDFRPELLSREMRVWYDRLWSAIRFDEDLHTSTGSLRSYGYPLQQRMFYLSTALRVTGDLRFLDEMAQVGEMISEHLTTQWYDPFDDRWYAPTDGTAGYRRWLYTREDDTESHHIGKDLHAIASHKTHAYVALLAYALHANRDASSPAGLAYGAKSDFWRTYLVEDFEAIWHIRSGTTHPEEFFQYGEGAGMSEYHSMLTYQHYLHALTGEDARREHADRYAATVAGAMYVAETGDGPAMIFSRPREHDDGLVPIAYARYTWALQVDLALDGHPTFADPAYMELHARTLARFVMDNGATDLAFDVGGMEDRTGTNWEDGVTTVAMPTQNPYLSSSLEWDRESFNRYLDSYMAPLAAFGETERITAISLDAYSRLESNVDAPEYLAIPTAMLLKSGFAW